MSRTDSIRREILLQLYGCRPLRRTASSIARECRRQGDDFTEHEIRAELHFLAKDGCIDSAESPGTTESTYEINARGIRIYEDQFAA